MLDLDDIEVISLENWSVPELSGPSSWPCGACGHPHLISMSWRVTVRRPDQYREYIVCHACAQRLRTRIRHA